MNRRNHWLAFVLALTVPLTLTGLQSSQADDLPIAVEPLTSRAEFADDVAVQIRNKVGGGPTDVLNLADPSRVVIARITVQPGVRFPWHTHPGPVVVLVSSGELTYVRAADCVHRRYTAGELFIDPGNAVHTAYNAGLTPAVLHATFLGVSAAGALTIPAPAPDGCDVDEGDATHTG
jgi:quercetin dioxygenase-like cupin family protein